MRYLVRVISPLGNELTSRWVNDEDEADNAQEFYDRLYSGQRVYIQVVSEQQIEDGE